MVLPVAVIRSRKILSTMGAAALRSRLGGARNDLRKGEHRADFKMGHQSIIVNYALMTHLEVGSMLTLAEVVARADFKMGHQSIIVNFPRVSNLHLLVP